MSGTSTVNRMICSPKQIQEQELEQNFGQLAHAREASGFDEARTALNRWTEAVTSNRIETVLTLYARDAVLVPTLSNEIHVTEAGRRSYFEFFLSRQVLGCTVEQEVVRADPAHGTVAIGGIYTFSFRTEDGGAEAVPARFLFTYAQIDGHWLITGHHSSRCV